MESKLIWNNTNVLDFESNCSLVPEDLPAKQKNFIFFLFLCFNRFSRTTFYLHEDARRLILEKVTITSFLKNEFFCQKSFVQANLMFYLKYIGLKGRDLSGFVFTELLLPGVLFENSNLENAKFIGTDLEFSKFIKCNLSGATFKKAWLDYSTFRDCIITEETDFTGADLSDSVREYSLGFSNPEQNNRHI